MNVKEAIDEIVWLMKSNAIPATGESMAAYLKDHFTCLGVKSPIRNEIQKEWFKKVTSNGLDTWDIVYSLWDLPEREFQYIALDYIKKKRNSFYQKEDFKKLEELIINKAWWDTVDSLASNPVGEFFIAYPELIDPVISEWRKSDNMWLNRTCLIFQLKYKDQVDFELLKSLIKQYQNVNEFFIQKAIGWSLRQYSKFNAQEVDKFVKEINLNGLAKREAIKYL